MIQDIFPHVLNNRFDPSKRPDGNSIILSFNGNDVLINGEVLPLRKDINVDDGSLVFLFSIDGDKDFFLCREAISLDGFEYVNVRTLRGRGFTEKYMAFALYTGLHLAHWYGNNKYCGKCGKIREAKAREESHGSRDRQEAVNSAEGTGAVRQTDQIFLTNKPDSP